LPSDVTDAPNSIPGVCLSVRPSVSQMEVDTIGFTASRTTNIRSKECRTSFTQTVRGVAADKTKTNMTQKAVSQKRCPILD